MMPASTAIDGLDLGTIIDNRYVVRQKIGRGNMATVYLATDEMADSEVAIKIMSDRLVGRPERVQRFFNEHRFAARVGRHDNVVCTFGDGRIGGDEGTPYLVMERVIGPSMAFMIALEERLAPAHATRIALGIARGLQAMHEAGVVHRDIKPSNIMIAVSESRDVEVPKIADFGLAVLLQHEDSGELRPRLTLHEQIPGSAGYMAPEAVGRVPPHPSADVFGFGMLLAEALVGRNPCEGIVRDDYLAEVTREDWSVPERVLDQIESAPLRSLVVACTRRVPEDRPTVAEVIQRLEGLAVPAAVRSIPPPLVLPVRGGKDEPRPAPRSKTRWAWGWIVAAILLLGLIAGLAVLMKQDSQRTQPRETTPTREQPIPASISASSTTAEQAATDETSTGGTGDATAEPSSSDDADGDRDHTTSSTGPARVRPPGPRKRHGGKRPKDKRSDDGGVQEPPSQTDGPNEVECATLRESVSQARRDGRWSRIPFNVKAKRACFGATEYRRLLVEALARSGRHEQCMKPTDGCLCGARYRHARRSGSLVGCQRRRVLGDPSCAGHRD